MNLMFWKKKSAGAEEAEGAGEEFAGNIKSRPALDFVEESQDAAGQEPELPEPEFADAGEGDPDTPSKPGLAARLRSRFDTLMGRFRRPPPFRATDDIAAEASGAGGEAETAADTKPDMDAPTRPGLAMRMKLQFIAIARRFRKKPESDGEGDDEGGDAEEAAQAPAKPGLLKRLKVAWAAFAREFKATAEPATGEEREEDEHDRSKSVPEEESIDAEPEAEPARSRKWLVVGGSIVIVILVLANFAIANWPIFKEPQKRWGTRHEAAVMPPRPPETGPEPEISPAEIEALMKKNAELQARIRALKNTPPPSQSSSVDPAWQAGESAAASSAGGELAVDSKDPKAAAMSLREAIEAMNAASGDYGKKPAK